MKIELSTFSTFPSRESYYWEIVIIPTVTILRVKEDTEHTEEGKLVYSHPSYIDFNFEWLFWSVTILIK